MRQICRRLLLLASATSPLLAPVVADDGPTAGKQGASLTIGKQATAKTEEKGKNHLAPHAVDGDLRTRWCAQGGQANEWLQVDLGKPQHVRSLRIHWEKADAAYRYRVESSEDGEQWRSIVDASKNDKVAKITPHKVDAPDTRFLRVTFLGSSTGVWGSLWELEAYAGALPELPKSVTAAAGGAAPEAQRDIQVNLGEDGKHAAFEVTLFGAPPEVNYPVCLAAAPTGEVFVGVDEQGSLGKKPGGGRVLRCRDTDGDGRADKINVFAEMDHPRGLFYDNRSLWVLHPPLLSVFRDTDGDGTSDEQQTLITGISSDQVNKRGADHTTNGIRVGIDGWIYIAVGDFGFTEAKGADGTTLSRRGGGIVRVRPDGGEMEVYAWGLRNILDVCIDPFMNVFTRDNTNDGGGWDIRVSHILQGANYGYPSLYKNFSDEIMPPLADYGGGSGCGGMYLQDARWPQPFGDAAYTCDWGRSEVYRHNFPAAGPTFAPHQQLFLKIPRPTDIDVDGRGLMYVSSWKDGKFDFSGPNVGFVAQIRPKDLQPQPFPDLASDKDQPLIDRLMSPSAVHRLHAQWELLRRGRSQERSERLRKLAVDDDAPLAGRVAAIYTIKQLDGAEAAPQLLELLEIPALREHALRALTDRASQLDRVPLAPLAAALADDNPRVRAQALIGLARLGERGAEAAAAVLPLTARSSAHRPPAGEPLHKQADPGRVLPHLAIRALVATNAIDACLKSLGGPHREGALRALRQIHQQQAVGGLARQLSTSRDPRVRREILTALIRLYHREGEYRGGWWGTRPDTSGPYFDRQKWAQSDRIASLVTAAAGDASMREHIGAELARHKVEIPGLKRLVQDPAQPAIAEQPIPKLTIDPDNEDLIANMPLDEARRRAAVAGDARRGQPLFKSQSCSACHTNADGQPPRGPHLVDIGKRYKRAELIESLLQPSAKIAQGFDTYSFRTEDGVVVTGFVVGESAQLVTIREANGISKAIHLDSIEARVKRELSMMPKGIVDNLTPEQLADLLAYLESLSSGN